MASTRRRKRGVGSVLSLTWLPTLLAKSRLALVLLALSAFVGAVVTVGSAARTGYRWYDSTFRWETRIENRVQSLRANVRIDEFDEILGRPRITVASDSGKSVQHIYQGRGHWVQAVADGNGTVVMFAVTVCDAGLHPAWQMQDGHGKYSTLTLQKDHILFDPLASLSEYMWFFSGATANSYIYSLYGGGNPTNYRKYGWGYNDVCRDRPPGQLVEMDAATRLKHWTSTPAERRGEDEFATPTASIPFELRDGFSQIPANTFFVFGITKFGDDDAHEFQIGADRILARTLVEP